MEPDLSHHPSLPCHHPVAFDNIPKLQKVAAEGGTFQFGNIFSIVMLYELQKHWVDGGIRWITRKAMWA
jgi:hypothetical protein